jgi:hypothetical protein
MYIYNVHIKMYTRNGKKFTGKQRIAVVYSDILRQNVPTKHRDFYNNTIFLSANQDTTSSLPVTQIFVRF